MTLVYINGLMIAVSHLRNKYCIIKGCNSATTCLQYLCVFLLMSFLLLLLTEMVARAATEVFSFM